MGLSAVDLTGVFTAPAPTPTSTPAAWTPEALDRVSGYGPDLPLDAASPTDAHVGEVVSLVAGAVTDLAGLPEEAMAVEIARRVEGYLRDFAGGQGAAVVHLPKVQAEARAALTREHETQRYGRLPEIRQGLVDTVTAWQEAIEAAHARRRQVAVPTFPDTLRMDPAAAQLVETRRQTDSHLRVLAALEVPAGTAPEVLLERLRTDSNPHVRVRAQALLEAQVPTLRVEATLGRAQGRPAEAARATAVLQGLAEAIEARVPDAVRQGEVAERQAWAAIAAAVGDVLVLLAVQARAGTATVTEPLLPEELAGPVRATIAEARAAMRAAWRPVWTQVTAARGARRR